MHRLRAVGALIVALLLPGLAPRSAIGQSTCPTAQLCCNETGCSASTDSAAGVGCPGEGAANAQYDAARGVCSSQAYAEYLGNGASVDVTDDFTVTGATPGAPLTFKVRLDASLTRQGYGGGNASLTQGSQTITTSVNGSIELTLTYRPGEAFRVTYGTSAFASDGGSGAVTARLVFADLPPGTSVTSCKGYRQDVPVPVRSTTWGGIKSLDDR